MEWPDGWRTASVVEMVATVLGVLLFLTLVFAALGAAFVLLLGWQ
jgi:hypothetical protein